MYFVPSNHLHRQLDKLRSGGRAIHDLRDPAVLNGRATCADSFPHHVLVIFASLDLVLTWWIPLCGGIVSVHVRQYPLGSLKSISMFKLQVVRNPECYEPWVIAFLFSNTED
jgi:hypothetical protein